MTTTTATTTTTTTTSALTIRDQIKSLGLPGDLSGAAIEAVGLLSDLRRERCRSREAAATAAAFAASGGQRQPAALLLRLEADAATTRRGEQDPPTERLAPFRALGTGRRQAHDGPAWTAAIEAAAVSLDFWLAVVPRHWTPEYVRDILGALGSKIPRHEAEIVVRGLLRWYTDSRAASSEMVDAASLEAALESIARAVSAWRNE